MFQTGTGERFKYKEAVKNLHPLACCKKYSYTDLSNPLVGYGVILDNKQISSIKRSAEYAWSDAYEKLVATKND